jgi:hypothetical protein
MVAVNMFRIRLGISGALAYGGIAPVIFFHVRLSVQMFAQSALLTRGRFS